MPIVSAICGSVRDKLAMAKPTDGGA